MSDIYATAMRAKAHPEIAIEGQACREMAKELADALAVAVRPWKVEQRGRGNIVVLVAGGREYRLLVTDGHRIDGGNDGA